MNETLFKDITNQVTPCRILNFWQQCKFTEIILQLIGMQFYGFLIFLHYKSTREEWYDCCTLKKDKSGKLRKSVFKEAPWQSWVQYLKLARSSWETIGPCYMPIRMLWMIWNIAAEEKQRRGVRLSDITDGKRFNLENLRRKNIKDVKLAESRLKR